MCQAGPLSHPHPPFEDRSERGPTSSNARAEHIFKHVFVAGKSQKPWSFERHSTPSSRAVTFNLKLGQFVDTRHPLKLVETLKEMKELGHKPDILTYNSAMELFGKLNMEDEAWALVDDMKALGIMPDIETYKFLLQVRTSRLLSWRRY